MLRFILIILSLLIFFVFSCVMFLVELIVGKISPRARDISQLRILQAYLKILLFLAGTHLTVRGKDKIPKDTPVLYILNHRSAFDIIISLSLCPDVTGYISKMEYKKVPLLSWWIVWLHGFFLDRTNIREGLKTILAAIENVKKGYSIAIFPEGTRSHDEDERKMLPFHEGSFKIATKTGCPIVPVVLTHTSEIFEDHVPKVRSRHVIIEYLDPVIPGELTKEEAKFIGRYVQGRMQTVLDANHEIPA